MREHLAVLHIINTCYICAQPETTDTTRLVHRAVCLFTPQLSHSLVLIAPTQRGMARLS